MSVAQPVLLGIDTGGTFTDFVLWRDGQLRIHKVLSTPAAPERAILQGIEELGLHRLDGQRPFYIVHGSTVATNAVLEGKGVRTAFVTNHGLGDMLSIGRQTRRELYKLQPEAPSPPVPKALCLETGGRIAADGTVLEPLSQDDLDALRTQIERLAPRAVAINLLFSYVDARAERAIEDMLRAGFPDLFVSRSSAILPEYKEYERGMTTWLNAYVGPLVLGYLQRLCAGVPHAAVSVMQSAGGTIAAEQAGHQAVHMLLSGPAGGLAAARYAGEHIGRRRLLTFDMGGTSTDVALIDGDLQLTGEGHIGGYPVAVPMVDMHTIGAGGGSLATVDPGGLLQVGPQSAGADPGPACYGKGGTEPTVTDANLVLGRLRPDAFLGGTMPLDSGAAHRAVASLGERLGLDVQQTAEGIVRLANEHMAQALRVMSIQRGIDPRALTLVSFGGAGGLHVCALADALGMRRAMAPVHGGVLSALGMLVAPRQRQLSQTVNLPLDQLNAGRLEPYFAPLIERGLRELQAEGAAPDTIEVAPSLDLRYVGQSYYLNVPWTDIEGAAEAFHASHEQRYGHRLDLAVEVVNVRVALSTPATPIPLQAAAAAGEASPREIALPGIDQPAGLWARDALAPGQRIDGPALITETVSTTFVAPGWSSEVDDSGNLLLSRE